MLSNDKLNLIKTYNTPVTWNVSGFGSINHLNYFMHLYDLCKRVGVEKFPFDYVNGCFLCKYNGGRTAGAYVTKDDVKKWITDLNDKGIGVKMTLSNTTISSKDFDDPYMRFLLDNLAETDQNGVICVVDEFAEFVKKNYPNLLLTASMVKTEVETKLGKTDTPEYYNSKFDLYDEVVINTARAFDDEFLDQITHPERIEVIVNHTCNHNCQVAGDHHKLIEGIDMIKAQCAMCNKDYRDDKCWKEEKVKLDKMLEACNKHHYLNNFDDVKFQTLNTEEINHLCDRGITRFKLEGRDLTVFEMFFNLMYYIFNRDSIMPGLYF